jgi:membrane-associated phospholipid phosphatase
MSLGPKLTSRAAWRSYSYLILPLGYTVGLVTYYLVSGRLFQFSPALFSLMVIPIVALTASKADITKYWVPFIVIMASYEALAGAFGSVINAKSVLSLFDIDKAIWGFNLTGWVQATFASTDLTDVATVLYSLHLPLVAVAAVLVWHLRRAVFGKYVTAMVLTSYAALFTFILIPTAPPWYDGVAKNLIQSFGPSGALSLVGSLTSLIESDKFAAFPSLHGAYAIIFTYFMFKVDKRIGIVSLPLTVGILFSTVYLGQHYVLDLIGGALYALVPCLISEHFQFFTTQKAKA